MTARFRCRPASVALLLAGAAALAHGQAASDKMQGSGIVYSCVTAQGVTLTSDRYIAQCTDREQRVFNRDGTASRVIPPTLTATERLAHEARMAKEQVARDAMAETLRRDTQLIRRFSSEEAHQRARQKALEPSLNARRISQARLKLIDEERKPLMVEAEFYKGKKLPTKLQTDFDVLDASVDAVHVAMKAQDEEMARINELYDIELERLKRLWAGAVPGTLGPMRAPVDPKTAMAAGSTPAGQAAVVKSR